MILKKEMLYFTHTRLRGNFCGGNPDNFKPRMVCLSAAGFEKQQGKPYRLKAFNEENIIGL